MADSAFDAIIVHNQDALEELAWAIEASQGQFSLILARCNYVSLREHLVEQLQEQCPVKVRITRLRQTSKTLYTKVREEIEAEPVEALMVLGLETVNDLNEMLPAMNSVREEFRKNFPFPIVIWVTDDTRRKLVQLAPDFESWATTTNFSMPPDALLVALREASDRLFTALLTPHSNRSFRSLLENLDLGFLQRSEVEFALQDLRQSGQPLTPDLQATLDFIRGLNAPSNEQALECFQRSLEYWREVGSGEMGKWGVGKAEEAGEAGEDTEGAETPRRRDAENSQSTIYNLQSTILPSSPLITGLLLYFVGRTIYNICSENKYRDRNWEPAKQPLQDCVTVFEQANRPDLVAKSITQFERVLDRLQAWDELEAAVQKSLPIQETYGHRSRLAQDYRYLALVGLNRGQGADAKRYAQLGLAAMKQVPADQRYQGLYLWTLAQAERLLDERDAAIAHLIEARSLGDQGFPRVYIGILENLRDCYLEQKDYLKAFRLKQERLSVEQQYQLRAFVGAGRLRPQLQDQELIEAQNPVETQLIASLQETMPVGVASWQRQRDLKQLVERIGRSDCKLIVIHGDSGVGKSSLISAGLVPVLEQRAIGIQDNLPVVVRTYTDWARDLGQRLASAMQAYRDRKRAKRAIARGEAEQQALRHAPSDDFNQQLDILQSDNCSADDVLGFLRQLDRNNLRTVLIFDQFEEFFFIHPRPAQRRSFFTFLGECLQLLSVNVVLPLREDYLHYLLEFNRVSEICATGIDTLSRTVLYPLGNFSASDAHAIIQELTEQARFYLEPALVNELVQDLTDESGEVRPIELQIVGAQLQTEGIRDLDSYRQLCESNKPAKEILVERYLAEVVADCGSENDRAAERVLYLLTDENNTRPLKTKAELAADMGNEASKLDLVLDILVRSGLVMLIPEVPADRYQLVHDYLVPYIRQQQGTNLLAELEQERVLRSLTEAELRETLKQLEKSLEQERQARQRAEIAEVDALSLSSQALFLLHDQLGGMVAGVKAGKKLKDTDAPEAVQRRVIARLRQAVYDIREVNRLHGHGDWVNSVCISPNGQRLASGSRDRTIKLWTLDGQELQTFSGHSDWVHSVCFNPNSQLLASGSGDDTAKLWTLDGHELVTFRGHSRGVRSVCFSPDGKILASGSSDCTIKLWSLDGKELQTFSGHRAEVTSVCFSPDGKILASGSSDCTIKLWSLDGKDLRTSSGHRAEVLCLSFSPDGQLLASGNSDNTIRFWSLDGLELKTCSSHRDRVVSICFSPDGQTVVSGSGDGTIKLWSLNGEVLQTFSGHSEWVKSVQFSPDGQTLISGSGDRTIRLWSLASRNRQILAGCGSRVSSVRLSPDNQLLASCGEDDAIRLWSLDGELIRTILGNSAGVNSISFSPDGRTLVSGGGNGMVKLWSLQGQELQVIGKHNRRVKWICFSPDGQLLASRSSSSIKLWNLDGQELAALYHPNLYGNVVCFSPDGQMVAADVGDGEGVVKLWNLHGEELHTFRSSIERINSLCFSPDGQSLAIGSGGLGTISLWSLDGEKLRTFLGHSANVAYLCYSPDGRILASGSGDRTVKLWSLDGEELQTFSDHSAGITDICFSSDGRFLASSSCDGTVILRNLELFNLDLDQLTNLGCDWLRNYLCHNPTLPDGDRHLCNNINP